MKAANHYDVLVIGGGLAGLVSAALLSRSGAKVLLLERHNRVGGFATNFVRGDFTFEVGLHQMDGCPEGSLQGQLFKELELEKKLEFIKLKDFYHCAGLGVEMTVPANRELAHRYFLKHFPLQRKGLDAFFNTISSIRAEIDALLVRKDKIDPANPLHKIVYPNITRYASYTVQQFLDEVISDKYLQAVLVANVGYYHDRPETLSFIFFASAQACYYEQGAYYIKGGSYELAKYLAQLVLDQGGKILTGTEVTNLQLRNSRVQQINAIQRYNQKQKLNFTADHVVYNGPIPRLFDTLIKDPFFSKYSEFIGKMEVGPTLVMAHFGFSKPLKSIGHQHYLNMFAQPKDLGAANNYKSLWAHRDLTFFSFVDYSQIDAGLCPDHKSVGVATALANYDEWQGLKSKQYREKKQQVGEELLDRLSVHIPGVRNIVEKVEVSTPRTIERFTLNSKGAVYGFSQIVDQSCYLRIPHESIIENLYYASAWTSPGGGFSGAMTSGKMAADLINLKFADKKPRPNLFSEL